MTSIFDGMAGVLNSVFGAPVLYTPKNGDPAQIVQAVLREGPMEVAGEDGAPVIILSPTLQVPQTVLADPRRGDRVALVDKPEKVFLIVNSMPGGSPATDAMIICELEEDLS